MREEINRRPPITQQTLFVRLARYERVLQRNVEQREQLVESVKSFRDVHVRPTRSRRTYVRDRLREILAELKQRERIVTVDSIPISISFIFDREQAVTPASFVRYLTENIFVSVPSEDGPYVFKEWSDGYEYPERLVRVTRNIKYTAIYEIVAPYELVEYAKYYMYLPQRKYDQRHFEVRAIFAIRSDVDPIKVGEKVWTLFDQVMKQLGIGIDEATWEIDWVNGKLGGESTGKSSETFITPVTATVVDILRGGKVYRSPKYPTDIDVSEEELYKNAELEE